MTLANNLFWSRLLYQCMHLLLQQGKADHPCKEPCTKSHCNAGWFAKQCIALHWNKVQWGELQFNGVLRNESQVFSQLLFLFCLSCLRNYKHMDIVNPFKSYIVLSIVYEIWLTDHDSSVSLNTFLILVLLLWI